MSRVCTNSEVGSSDPATFVVVGERDGIAPPSIMERRVALLRQAGTEVEYHRYPASVTVSVLVLARVPKDGPPTPFASGRNRSSESPSRPPGEIELSTEGSDESVHSDNTSYPHHRPA